MEEDDLCSYHMPSRQVKRREQLLMGFQRAERAKAKRAQVSFAKTDALGIQLNDFSRWNLDYAKKRYSDAV